MRHAKSEIRAGLYIQGGINPVEVGPYLRRDAIQTGMFLTGAPCPGAFVTKTDPPPPPRFGDQQAALTDIEKRIEAARKKLALLAAARRD